MIDGRFIDRPDQLLVVRVAGNEDAYCFRMGYARVPEQFDGIHMRHSVIAQQEIDVLIRHDLQCVLNARRH